MLLNTLTQDKIKELYKNYLIITEPDLKNNTLSNYINSPFFVVNSGYCNLTAFLESCEKDDSDFNGEIKKAISYALQKKYFNEDRQKDADWYFRQASRFRKFVLCYNDLPKFKSLLEWFVKQLKINGKVILGVITSGRGYKNDAIRSDYAPWRKYHGFTLDATMQCGWGIGKSLNYIHLTDSWVNIIAEYQWLNNRQQCDVIGLKVIVKPNQVVETEYPAVSTKDLGLFDGLDANANLIKFYYEYLVEIRKYLNRTANPQTIEKNEEIVEETTMNYPLNQILYGPPGTGKTYNTVCYALAILENKPVEAVQKEMAEDQEAVFARYQTFLNSGRIAFTTFHQSFGYEEFIEGIKPELNESGEMKYVKEPGVFKKFCNKAKILRSNITDKNYFFNGEPTVWKVSLAGTGKNPVRKECLDNDHIRIGWDQYGENVTDETIYSDGGKYILEAFINTMKKGDIVLSCFSANTIDAIGVVTGDYEWHDEYDHYKRLRKVKWLVKDINRDIVSLNDNKQMTLSAVYRLNVSVEDIVTILNNYSENEESEAYYEYPDKHVFIIDEINRGNVSKIFGELITLIEETKRLGNREETQCILPYSGEKFGVPKNVYILGTMNTADRSLVQLDAALRRRFSFIEMMPAPTVIPVDTIDGIDVKKMLSVINERITALIDREHQIGHAYFMELNDNSTVNDLAEIFKKKIVPQLQEYFYDDYAAIQEVLSDQFIEQKEVHLRADSRTIYNIVIPKAAEGYISIYENE